MWRIYWRRSILSIGFLLCVLFSYAQYVVTGGAGSPLKAELESGDAAERLELYLVDGSQNLSIQYTSSTSVRHQWYRYQTHRLAAEKIPSVQSGYQSVVQGIEPGYGYFVDEGAVSRYVWVADYRQYQSSLSHLGVSDSGDPCSGVLLEGEGAIPPIYYYWPNSGARRELHRQHDVIYQTLEYDREKGVFLPKEELVTIKGSLFETSFPAPLCDTEICVKGDYFARHFGKEQSICVDLYQATAVEAYIDTMLVEEETPNLHAGKRGYNAPATLRFRAVSNTPTAALHQWKIYPQGDEKQIIVQFSGEEMEYTFNQAGTFVVRLLVSDQSTSCTVEDELTIEISESYLKVPNAFSPGSTPGVNDEFRVIYKSLVNFKAWIFNRWGVEVFHWTDPARGWDGRKGGKYVQPGVYFYVIEAEGSDGIHYKLKGDINIVRPKTNHENYGNIQE